MASVKSTKPYQNGHVAAVPLSDKPAKRSGFLPWVFSASARLFTWYCILTILFRCPANIEDCSSDSPPVCKPYLQAKHAVAPHVEPYYETYAAPYVQQVKPYYDAVDRSVITPGRTYAVQYGAPRLAQAQQYGLAQWERNVQPGLAKYQLVARAKYDQSVAPHLDQWSAIIRPYYELAHTKAVSGYEQYLLPTYAFSKPYAVQSYDASLVFARETAIPASAQAWKMVSGFIFSNVWPHVSIVYHDNVEPQLVKIGQRLGRYSDGSSTKTPSDPFTSSSYKKATQAVSSTVKSVSEKIMTPSATPSSLPNPITAPEHESDENDTRRSARDTVAEDLRAWQEKYAKAADEGAAAIEEQVAEISTRLVNDEVSKTGQGLVKALDQAIMAEMIQLRQAIVNIVQEVEAENLSPETAKTDVLAPIRRSGTEIKNQAQEIRSWLEAFQVELQTQVTHAAESHFAILDSIKDLALQKIGMKWAWMDGVTYKDWAKYHELKSRFQEWGEDLERLVVTHPGLDVAQSRAQAVEDEGMSLAAAAAKELARLKQVAQIKIDARDATDEFDIEKVEAIAKAKEEEARAAAEARVRAEAEAAQAAAEAEAAEAEAAAAAAAASDTAASEHDTEDTTTTSPIDTATNQAAEIVDSASAESQLASENVQTDEPATSDASSSSSETPADADSPEASAETHTPPSENDEPEHGRDDEDPNEEEDEEDSQDPSTHTVMEDKPTTSVAPAMFGAAAESVPTRKPILDDEEDMLSEQVSKIIENINTGIPQSVSSAASSAYVQAMSHAHEQYENAVTAASKNLKASPEPTHENMVSSVSSAYGQAISGASAQLDGVMQLIRDGVHSMEKLSDLAPTPTPDPSTGLDWKAVESIAKERYGQALSWAEEQYEHATVAAGLAAPTPSTAPELVQQALDNARHNYYAGVGLAHARYSGFIDAASSAFNSMRAGRPTPTGISATASSVASVAQASASSVASAAQESAASAASAASEEVASGASAGYEGVLSAPENLHEEWKAILSQVSTKVYGAPAPTPRYEQVRTKVIELAEAATSAAEQQAASIDSVAAKYAGQASVKGSEQYAAISSLVSELVVGKEPTFSESVASRLEAAFATATKTVASVFDQATLAAQDAEGRIAHEVSRETDKAKSAAQSVRDEL